MSKKSALLACLSSILMVLMFIDGSVTSAAPVLYEFKESNSVMDFIHVYNEHTKYNGLKVDTKTNSISIENCMQINNRKSKKIASGSTIGKKESMSHSIPVSDLKFKHLFNDINLKNTALNTGLDIEWPNQCDFHGDKYDAYVVIVKG